MEYLNALKALTNMNLSGNHFFEVTGKLESWVVSNMVYDLSSLYNSLVMLSSIKNSGNSSILMMSGLNSLTISNKSNLLSPNE